MTEAQTPNLAELDAALAMLSRDRYQQEPGSAEADAKAVAAGDTEYLLAHIHWLQAKLDLGDGDVAWVAPTARNSPAQSLRRIKALCAAFPDLFSALFVVSATHVTVSREMLAMAVKQFRRDTDGLSQEDVAGLLVSVLNGANQAFDAVLRTRKGAERKVTAALPWGSDKD